MRRLHSFVVVALLVLLVGPGFNCAAEDLVCRPISLSDIFWLASYDDESGRTKSNHAEIVRDSDEHGEYYSMEWSSPEDSDLTIGDLAEQERSGVIGFRLSLSASQSMDVLPVVSVSGDYCGRTWRFATAAPISVGEERQEFVLSVLEFIDDPFMGCADPLQEDALESLDSIILFPMNRTGELRVYEVGLCTGQVEQASAEPYVESQADEDTQAPDDREPEDVVNTECSSNPPLRIAFHPERPEIKPGETVHWTIEIPEEMLPLHAKIEFDNDQNYDMELDLTECRTLLQFVYEEANVYAPFLVYQDVNSMAEHKVYSDEVVGVLPELESREGLGIRIATQESPVSTYIKGFNIAGIDGELFETDSGRAWIRGELQQIRDVGANMVMYNIHWFADDTSASSQEPIYYGAWPAYHQDTVTVSNLVDLVDWAHEVGLLVGFRPFLTIKGNYDSTLRAEYSPTEDNVYIRQQSQMKSFYARLAKVLGVEIFDLAAEEAAFTLHPRGGEVASAVSEEMGDRIALTPAENPGDIYRCPYLEDLDLVGCTDYVLDSGDFEGIPPDALSLLVQYHFQEEFEQLLLQFSKPGFLGELGINLPRHGYTEGARRASAYLSALHKLSGEGSPIVGVLWWDWVLSKTVIGPHTVKDTILESVLREYFTDALPDEVRVDFGPRDLLSPHMDLMVDPFDHGAAQYETWEYECSLRLSNVFTAHRNSRVLHLGLDPALTDTGRYAFIWTEYSVARDWSGYSSLNFWVRSENDNFGIEVGMVDGDGDRFAYRIDTRPYLIDNSPSSGGWQHVSIPFEFFANPGWADTNDGVLDLSRIRRWGFGILFSDQGRQDVWLDDLYLSWESPID